ncbi:rcc01693 family protein [Ensifer soli]|uniref:rcc01693 family protein n=1 Tax=Ciceribacter sp. sgz301302 TaxID=3342379 RepID=UPI0035B78259
MRAAAGAAAPFPWETAMTAGFRLLRLGPSDFWAMTPRELAAALGSGDAVGGPSRASLAALMAAYPDRRTDDGGLR